MNRDIRRELWLTSRVTDNAEWDIYKLEPYINLLPCRYVITSGRTPLVTNYFRLRRCPLLRLFTFVLWWVQRFGLILRLTKADLLMCLPGNQTKLKLLSLKLEANSHLVIYESRSKPRLILSSEFHRGPEGRGCIPRHKRKTTTTWSSEPAPADLNQPKARGERGSYVLYSWTYLGSDSFPWINTGSLTAPPWGWGEF